VTNTAVRPTLPVRPSPAHNTAAAKARDKAFKQLLQVGRIAFIPVLFAGAKCILSTRPVFNIKIPDCMFDIYFNPLMSATSTLPVADSVM
jgi:hypothetical protein